MRNTRAVTLVELLIASSIAAVILLSIYAAFQSGVFGHRALDEKITSCQAFRAIFDQINKDLRNSFSYVGKQDEMGFSGNAYELNFFATIPVYGADTLTRRMAKVSYSFDPKGKLMRSVLFNRDAVVEDADVVWEEMADKVNVAFEYGFIEQEKQELTFKNAWGVDLEEEKKRLPVAVRVTLKKDDSVETVTRTFYLPMAEVN